MCPCWINTFLKQKWPQTYELYSKFIKGTILYIRRSLWGLQQSVWVYLNEVLQSRSNEAVAWCPYSAVLQLTTLLLKTCLHMTTKLVFIFQKWTHFKLKIYLSNDSMILSLSFFRKSVLNYSETFISKWNGAH